MVMLHLFLRARRDAQSYDNDWIGDYSIRSIKTYEQVAEYCRRAMDAGTPIRIHRRRFEQLPATVCAECHIKSVVPEGNGLRVQFERCRSLSFVHGRRLQQGYYFAHPSEYEVDDTDPSGPPR
jgi:hypothetical protein